MPNRDIRWIQRFQNYQKAFAQLREAVELSRQRALSKLEQQGLIQAFEYTHADLMAHVQRVGVVFYAKNPPVMGGGA